MRKTIHYNWCRLLVIFVALFVFLTPSLEAKGIKLTDVIVNNSSNDLLAFFNVRNCFDSDTKKALMNGLTIRLTLNIRLYQVYHLWPDSLLASLDMEHSIRYDALKEEFFVDLDGKKLRFREVAKAQQAVSEITGVPVIALKKLTQNNLYQLQIKAVLEKEPTSSAFHYIISLFSFWDSETDNYSVEFKY